MSYPIIENEPVREIHRIEIWLKDERLDKPAQVKGFIPFWLAEDDRGHSPYVSPTRDRFLCLYADAELQSSITVSGADILLVRVSPLDVADDSIS